MKIAVAGIFHETNTFAPGLTNLDAFHSEWVYGNDAFLNRYSKTRTSMGGVVDAMHEAGAELSCGLYTAATPSGMVTSEAAADLIAAAVESIDTSAEGAVAILHGAMVAQGIPDMEGEFLRQARVKLGPSKPLAVLLDLHANISQEMVLQADIIIGYDTYPHIDAYERAVEAVMLLVRTIRGEIRPVLALAQPGMLIVPQVMLTDEEGPMKEIMNRAFAIERESNVLNVTVAGGFPYSDIPDAGVAFVVMTNNDPSLAECYAEELKQMAWDFRERLQYEGCPAKEAVAKAMAMPDGPVILVEGSDNVGAGAPADATHILIHLTDPLKKSLIVIRDEEAVAMAQRLGVGEVFEGEIGGKSDHLHGSPVRVKGIIRTLFDGKYTHIGPYMTGNWAYMGKTAVIESGRLTVILTENRTAPWDIGHVSSVGLRPIDFHIIVVKAAIAWRTAFGPICRSIIYVNTPGCCSSDLTHFHYEQLRRPIYPLN
ncbi:M81 family metallopeptidase [Paenibacillus agricola]|uniref:M81 family metallopeptidase n=1 Tax=Paenibacillus agricola TaxID=2716264 RepID=A0ABX0J7H8_9BACL|nr:M81 family metallopeptidase [Paenibacillus agricola]NHN31761.1 M81 family metallopeptidase [Paenibacillus agricola]